MDITKTHDINFTDSGFGAKPDCLVDDINYVADGLIGLPIRGQKFCYCGGRVYGVYVYPKEDATDNDVSKILAAFKEIQRELRIYTITRERDWNNILFTWVIREETEQTVLVPARVLLKRGADLDLTIGQLSHLLGKNAPLKLLVDE